MTGRQSLACWGSSILACAYTYPPVPFSFSQRGGRAYTFYVLSVFGLFNRASIPGTGV